MIIDQIYTTASVWVYEVWKQNLYLEARRIHLTIFVI